MNALVYQIFYDQKQRPFLDETFVPLDVSLKNNPRWCEYQVFLDNVEAVEEGAADFYGFLSWKFFIKSHLRGQDFLQAITVAEAADAFFVNPYETSIAGLYKSVWSQLESVYPGVMPIIQQCFDDAGYDLDLSAMIMSKEQMAFCNYWVGKKAFWKEYMAFTRPLYDYLEYQIDEKTRTFFVQLDRKNRLGLCPHIMERMFSTFLVVERDKFKGIRIPLPSSIQEIDPNVVVACNEVKIAMIALANERAAQTVLDAQDKMLSHLLRYKQASEKAARKGTLSRWMSAVSEKITL
jgi:hypothetical protein